MSILETILKAQGGGLLKQISGVLGLPGDQAGSAISKLLPALTSGMKSNVAKPGGLESLLGALKGGGHTKYLDNPDSLTSADGISDGNSILGHLLGSKDASRKVAAEAAESTGIDLGILKKLLPMVATMAMGSLGKAQSSGGALASMLGAGSSAGGGMLTSFLDKDNDGSIVDDLLGMAKKFF